MIDDITIIIPTFHRPGYLRQAVSDLSFNLPEAAVVVAKDDERNYSEGMRGLFRFDRDRLLKLPYDSGLTVKRNEAVKVVETKYTLIGSDDFDFSTPEVRKGIIEMAIVLNHRPSIDVVVGRYQDRDYHGFLEYNPVLGYIKERRISIMSTPAFSANPIPVWKIDIGPNFFLARTQVLRDVPWDENIRPIGGEHADFFLDLKAAGKTVVYLPFANVNEQERDPSKQDPEYPALRRRCWDGHELFMKKRGIKKYFGFDEEITV
jgi:hypothetical protein